MRVYYDTEFLEKGKEGISPISIGMVREDGQELYAIFNPLPTRLIEHTWLMKHVVPFLPVKQDGRADFLAWDDSHPDIKKVRTAYRLVGEVSEFLKVPDLELWAWYGAYDHVVLAQLFGTMDKMPDHIPYCTYDIRQEWARKGFPSILPKQARGTNHNAIHDARHNRDMWNALFPSGAWKT